MARFVKHTACSSCGSRDNRAEYDDGSSYCFGCGSVGRATSPVFSSPIRETEALHQEGTREFSADAMSWLHKYDIRAEEAIRFGFTWDQRRRILWFPFYSEDGALVCLQGRNFSGHGPKYLNEGSREEAFPFYSRNDGVCVLVEDNLSAIRIARHTSAIPIIGATVSVDKLMRLYRTGVRKMVVWLDSNKWKESRNIAEKLKWIGCSSYSLFTEKDPKEYDDETIKRELSEYLPKLGEEA